MIKLENVSTERLIDYTKRLSNRDRLMQMIYELLFVYDISDYQRLKDVLDSDNEEFNLVSNFLYDELSEVEYGIKNDNNLDLKPEIFTFDNCKDSNIDDKTLKITDESNNGNVLLYTSPMVRGGARVNQLRHMSIDEIKYLASHLSSYKFKNALTIRRNFGIDTVKRVVDKVKFYEEQVLRQSLETNDREINLFLVNKDTKDEIVESQLKDIVEYIVDNAKECVWGNLTDTQKNQMMRAALSTRGEYILQDRRNLIDTISNYTILSELENGVIKKKTLDRFIVR